MNKIGDLLFLSHMMCSLVHTETSPIQANACQTSPEAGETQQLNSTWKNHQKENVLNQTETSFNPSQAKIPGLNFFLAASLKTEG